MKKLIGLTVLTLGVFVSSADARCYQRSHSDLGPVVAPFCRQQSPNYGPPPRPRYIQGSVTGCAGGCGGGNTRRPPRVEYIPQPQPQGGYRCEINGRSGWCVD